MAKRREEQKVNSAQGGFSFISAFNILGTKRQEEVDYGSMEREEQELKVKKD
jgi:hypothetical protein